MFLKLSSIKQKTALFIRYEFREVFKFSSETLPRFEYKKTRTNAIKIMTIMPVTGNRKYL